MRRQRLAPTCPRGIIRIDIATGFGGKKRLGLGRTAAFPADALIFRTQDLEPLIDDLVRRGGQVGPGLAGGPSTLKLSGVIWEQRRVGKAGIRTWKNGWSRENE